MRLRRLAPRLLRLASLPLLAVGAWALGCVSTHLYDGGPAYAPSAVPSDVGAVVVYWPPSASAKITGYRVWCNHRSLTLYAGGYGAMWFPPGGVRCAALDIAGGHVTPVDLQVGPAGTAYVRLDVSVLSPSIQVVGPDLATGPGELAGCHLVPGGRGRRIVED